MLFFEQVLAEARERGLTSERARDRTCGAEAALELMGDIPRRRRITLGSDKDYDGWTFTFALAAYNLVRIRNLSAVPA